MGGAIVAREVEDESATRKATSSLPAAFSSTLTAECGCSPTVNPRRKLATLL